MTTKKGVWDLQDVRDKQLQSLWDYSNSSNLMVWGRNHNGQLAQNDTILRSSPVQLSGTWSVSEGNSNTKRKGDNSGGSEKFIKSDGTLWSWGTNNYGQLGQNNTTKYSSPVQIPGTNWAKAPGGSPNNFTSGAIKTDGTLWIWGRNDYGQLGLSQSGPSNISSPTQLGSDTTWSQVLAGGEVCSAIKTDGTLWIWGRNHHGQLGLNDLANRSSPIQISGTTWIEIAGGYRQMVALKSDGTLWSWGDNYHGALGINLPPSNHPSYENSMSSPVQVPGTTWRSIKSGNFFFTATKTDGTLWSWGTASDGQLGVNNTTKYSAPIQIGSDTTWDIHDANLDNSIAIKTDGTLWVWGANNYGQLGLNESPSPGKNRSSPTQVPGTWQNAITGSNSFAWPS